MTPASSPDSSTVDRETAELRLTNRLSFEAVMVALAQSGDPTSIGGTPRVIPFRMLHKLATGSYEGDVTPLLDQISQDFNKRRQFRGILGTVSIARQQQQAAAASRDSASTKNRPGPAFDLVLSASSRDDGAIYLQIKFHTNPSQGAEDDLDGPRPTMLFADCDGHFTMVRLPEMMDDTIQIMLDQSHAIVQAVRDPETEFFIR
ncbi:MAG: hypothetical protein CMM73_03615 [Rhodospirillaceae bacterium]|nr:hypothetical protein [Rhodospirillaceae bacterium]